MIPTIENLVYIRSVYSMISTRIRDKSKLSPIFSCKIGNSCKKGYSITFIMVAGLCHFVISLFRLFAWRPGEKTK